MAVLLVNDYWKRNDKNRQTLTQINTTLSQKLYNRGVKTYSTTLALTDEDDDLKHARTKGVIIIQPQPTKRKKVPDIAWLGEYHSRHFPNLPTDVGYIVGYSATTLDVASILKEEKYPDSKLVIINTIKPQQAEEDGQHQSDDYSAYAHVDVVFSFGKATHAAFLSMKEKENLAPDARVYDEVEVISALCGGLGGSVDTKSWVNISIEMKDVAAPCFHPVPKPQQHSQKSNAASAVSPTQMPCQVGRNYPTLVRNMSGKHILKYLVQDGIISIEKQREMKEEAGQRKQRLNELILDEIAGGGDRAVQSLCSALRQDDVKEDYLAVLLEPKTQTPAVSPRTGQVHWQPPYNIVLLGRTGSGKSASGNSIVGDRVFEESDMGGSETKICDNAKACIDGYILNVIDTPGFADTDVPHETVVKEISRVHVLAHSGIHAIILVFRFPPRFTDEEKRAYDSLLQMFRQDILKHVIILYTYGDDFEKKAERHGYTLEGCIFNDSNPKWFKELLKHVQNRYLIFDNYTDDQYKKESQRSKLLQKILEVMAGTKNQPFNNKYTKIASEMCEEAQLALEEEKKQRSASATIIKASDDLPWDSEAVQQIAQGAKPKVGFKLPDKKKMKKKKRGGKKHTRKEDNTVSGNTVAVPGFEDDEPAGQWTECQPRSARSNPRGVQNRRSSSLPAFKAKGESPAQYLKDDAARVVKNYAQGAAAAVHEGDQTPSTQPEGQLPNSDTVTKEAVIHQKFGELMDLVKQDKGQGKTIMQKLEKEVKKDAQKDCLPSSSSVLMIDSTGEVTEVPLCSISVGDKVKVSAATFEPVFLYSHAVEDVLSTFISVTTEGGKTVSLSQSHLIAIIKDGKNVTVAAKDITEGDKVYAVEGSTGCLVPDKVVNVHLVLKSGQYCPHTYSGAMIVNGVYVSCYTDKLPLRLAHGLLLPLGWLHRACPRLFRLLCAPGETDGVPWWMGKLDDMLTWWRLA